jgi:transposase
MLRIIYSYLLIIQNTRFCSNCRAEVDRDINAMINIKEIAPKKLSVKNNKTASADKRGHGDDSNA